MRGLTPFIAALVLPVALQVTAHAQTPAAQPPPPAAGSAPPAPAPPTPPANYTYSVDGRRDPFVALIERGTTRGSTRPEVRAEGLAGLGTDELVVRGIIESQGSWMAMVSGPSGKSYPVRAGARLADGTVRAVTPEFLVILQQVDDPLSLEKQREVRKFLRGGENK